MSLNLDNATMPQPRLKVVQGLARDFTRQTPNDDGSYGAGFVSSDAITSKVWAGDSQTALATPTVVWGSSTVTPAAGAPVTLWTIQFNAADTSSLTPGLYRCQVFATHASRTGCLFDGLVEVIDTAGSSSDGDLVTYTYVETLLAPLRLKAVEREMIWLLKGEASDAIRKHCGQRDFTRQTYTKEYVAELNGQVALDQMPVNNVLRIRGYKQTVLNVSASPAVNQQAWVSMSTSGDWYTNTLTYTGITLNAVSNGALTTNSFAFATYTTINSLAAAVAAVPSWSAVTTPVFGLYPSTDLSAPGGLTSQGAMDDDGCELQAYTEDLTCCRLQNRTGFLWVGRHRVSSAFGQRWGEDWELLEDADGPIGRVQVTFDAGFNVIPTPVQLACAELVGQRIMRLRKDHRLRSEDNGVYKYEISDKDIADLPYPTRCALGKWRMVRAS